MKTQTVSRTCWICLLLLGVTATAFAQLSVVASAPTPTPTPTRIMYTGKLLGYFRVPSLQEFRASPGCPTKSGFDSDAARMFMATRDDSQYRNAILVGTGDNFSPQLEARVFSKPDSQGDKYAIGNKELFVGHGAEWLYHEKLKDPQYADIKRKIEGGLGTIPTDNVGCFLRAARYDAIVPGKHDFYFGPERVRQLARFLASPDLQSNLQAVQMLGANLVMKTVPIEESSVSAKVMKERWFKEWPKGLLPINLKDGFTVYPWFSYVKFHLVELHLSKDPAAELNKGFSADGLLQEDLNGLISKTQLEVDKLTDMDEKTRNTNQLLKLMSNFDDIRVKRISVCKSTGDPNEVSLGHCRELENPQIRLVGNTVVYYLSLPVDSQNVGKNRHFSTLLAATNYGLCTDTDSQSNTKCLRFSVHRPFFYFPHDVPQQSLDGYTDPDPIVMRDDEVSIFGVVDPDLGQHVGTLNFGWRNENGLTTRLRVEDPVDALRQQLDYLDYLERREHKNFHRIKVLLAQMTPQRAKALAARFPEFKVVVSAADLEQGTSELEQTIYWQPGARVGALMAVPTPYFNSTTRKAEVHFGTIDASDVGMKWKLQSVVTDPGFIDEPEDAAVGFWARIQNLPNCLPSGFRRRGNTPANQELLRLLVLCAMRDEVQADLALIQTRDLYEKLPMLPVAEEKQLLNRSKVGTRKGKPPTPTGTPTGAEQDENVQQMLDRLIWKGDFLTLLYVPGSDLKKALDQSKRYAAEEKATLSLSAERGRTLERLGVTESNGEYIINELPLEDTKIYALATTDYIGAGDTGYPDLIKAALNARTHPAAYTKPLVSISSLVCRRLFSSNQVAKYCLGPISPDEYLDSTTAEQTKPYRRLTFGERFFAAAPFKWPGKSKSPTEIPDGVEQRVQRRPIWTLSLRKLSFTISDLNNNLTKDEIKSAFAGISETSSVTAEESRTYNIEVATRLSRSSHEREIFLDWGLEYKRIETGDKPTLFTVSQQANRIFSDAGFVWWRKPGRAAVNIGASISLHAESPLKHPFTSFTLATPGGKDNLRVDFLRNLLLLPRLGLRWQNRKNSFEFGFQAGRDFNALSGFTFTTSGEPVVCPATSGITFAKCVSDNSNPATGGRITVASQGAAIYQDRPRAGGYWKTFLSIPIPVPFVSSLRYEFEDEGDWFFVNFHRDTNSDARFRDRSKHKISFSPFSSISIGPSLQLLMFQNKRNHDFLFQRQLGIETTISFDIFNRREKGVQVKRKP